MLSLSLVRMEIVPMMKIRMEMRIYREYLRLETSGMIALLWLPIKVAMGMELICY